MKIQLIGNYTLDFLGKELKTLIREEDKNYNILISGFNQYAQDIINPDSSLYNNSPEIIFISLLLNKIIEKELFNIDSTSDWDEISNTLDELFSILEILTERLPTSVILIDNFYLLDGSLFVTLDYNTIDSYAEIEQYCNLRLLEFLKDKEKIKIVDIKNLIMQEGRENIIDYRLYYSAKSHWSLLGLRKVSNLYRKYIKAYIGERKKCIVLDLDNTLWGGIIGEDGINGINGIILSNDGLGKSYYDFQVELKRLHNMGIILAINSKNTESIALEAIRQHPYMVLKEEDFLVKKINWKNKADNIRSIANEINIGLDSMIFLDDSARERENVKTTFPQVEVPELPSDSTFYPNFIRNLDFFNFLIVTDDDKKRNASYQSNVKRKKEIEKYTDITNFYYSLKLIADVQKADQFSGPRVAQLTQKTNQYNFRTIRYTEKDILKFVKDKGFDVFTLQLEDKYGDNGIVGCVITNLDYLEKSVFIDTFILSCRVIGLTAETALLNSILTFYKTNGFETLNGEIVPTKKNIPCREFYKAHGFHEKDGIWHIDIQSYKHQKIDWIKFKTKSIGVTND